MEQPKLITIKGYLEHRVGPGLLFRSNQYDRLLAIVSEEHANGAQRNPAAAAHVPVPAALQQRSDSQLPINPTNTPDVEVPAEQHTQRSPAAAAVPTVPVAAAHVPVAAAHVPVAQVDPQLQHQDAYTQQYIPPSLPQLESPFGEPSGPQQLPEASADQHLRRSRRRRRVQEDSDPHATDSVSDNTHNQPVQNNLEQSELVEKLLKMLNSKESDRIDWPSLAKELKADRKTVKTEYKKVMDTWSTMKHTQILGAGEEYLKGFDNIIAIINNCKLSKNKARPVPVVQTGLSTEVFKEVLAIARKLGIHEVNDGLEVGPTIPVSIGKCDEHAIFLCEWTKWSFDNKCTVDKMCLMRDVAIKLDFSPKQCHTYLMDLSEWRKTFTVIPEIGDEERIKAQLGMAYKKNCERIMKKQQQSRESSSYKSLEMLKLINNKLSEGRRSTMPMGMSSNTHSQPLEFDDSEVIELKGHKQEVGTCAWSPAGSILASGSYDSTARIWTIEDNVVLGSQHVQQSDVEFTMTVVDWNEDGTLLATGSPDGKAKTWNTNGELKSTFGINQEPICAIKWDKKGDYLFTGSTKGTGIVWDVKTEQVKQQCYLNTEEGVTYVDWRNDGSFATCTGKMIYVFNLGENQPVKSFAGHQRHVNCVEWSPTGSMLASCSDDCTAKIWSMERNESISNLVGHTEAIYKIVWRPTEPGTENQENSLLLASASEDRTVKLWDARSSEAFRTLDGHMAGVYSVSFSPDGKLLATGSVDGVVNVWSIQRDRIMKSYKYLEGEELFEVCWNSRGSKIAACFNNGTVCVFSYIS